MFKPELIYFNEVGYKNRIAHLEKSAQRLQEVVDCYHQLGLPPLKPQELVPLFTDIDSLFFDKMTDGKGLFIAGIRFNKSKALDIIEKPDGWQALIDLVNQYHQDRHRINRGLQLDEVHLFELNQGKVRVIPSIVKQTEEGASYFTQSQRGHDQLQALKKVLEGIHQLVELGAWHDDDYTHPCAYLEKFILRDGKGKYRVNPTAIGFVR